MYLGLADSDFCIVAVLLEMNADLTNKNLNYKKKVALPPSFPRSLPFCLPVGCLPAVTSGLAGVIRVGRVSEGSMTVKGGHIPG